MLNYLYGGNLIRPTGIKIFTIIEIHWIVKLNFVLTGNEAQLGNLLEYDQSEFFQISPPSASSMDNVGYIYVPTSCANLVQCKLHIAFHGCQQGRWEVQFV